MRGEACGLVWPRSCDDCRPGGDCQDCPELDAEAVNEEAETVIGRTRARHAQTVERRPHVLRGVVITLLVLAIAAYAGSTYMVSRMFRHRVVKLEATPDQFGLTAETVSAISSDGIPIVAWWVPAGTASRGVVLVLHGMDGLDASSLLGHAKFLHDAGYSVIVPDLRAHGRSGGERIGLAFEEPRDVAAMLDWVKAQPGLSGQPVTLLGLSLGGATAIRTAAARPDVAAVVSVSAFASVDRMLGQGMKLMGAPDALVGIMTPFVRLGMATVYRVWPATASPLHDIPGIAPRPVLIMHGTADSQVPVENARLLAGAAGANARLTLVDGADHLVYRSPDALGSEDQAYRSEILTFLSGVTK